MDSNDTNGVITDKDMNPGTTMEHDSDLTGAAYSQTNPTPGPSSENSGGAYANNDNNWTKIDRSKSKRSKRNERKVRQLLSVDDIFATQGPYFQKTILVKFTR